MYRIATYGLIVACLVLLAWQAWGCAAQTSIGELTGIRNAIAAVSARIDETHQEADQQISNVSGTVLAVQETVSTTFDSVALRIAVAAPSVLTLAFMGLWTWHKLHRWSAERKNGQRERYLESMRKP